MKNCDRGLENVSRGRRRGQSFSPYEPTLSRQITFFLRLVGLIVGLRIFVLAERTLKKPS